MEDEKKKNSPLVIVLFVVVLIAACIIGWLLGTKAAKDEEEEPVTINSFEKVEVADLDTKLGQLDFSNKTTANKSEDEWLTSKIEVVDGKSTVTITVNEEGDTSEKSYIVDGVENVVSVGTGISVQGNGTAEFYILTSAGEVFHIADEIGDVKTTENYIGTANNMNIKEATSIAVVDENFNLADDAVTTTPTVYIKTKDGRVFTDEPIKSQSGLIEVVKK